MMKEVWQFFQSEGIANPEEVACDRHGGLINVLYADGSVSSRPPVGSAHASGFEALYPRSILWDSGGVLTYEAKYESGLTNPFHPD